MFVMQAEGFRLSFVRQYYTDGQWTVLADLNIGSNSYSGTHWLTADEFADDVELAQLLAAQYGYELGD